MNLRRTLSSVWSGALLVIVSIAVATLGGWDATRAEDVPDGPIDPNNGEQSLLGVVNSIPVNDIFNALNNFPVPYVIYAQAGSADPVIANNRAGSPTRIDADRSKATGQGGSGQDLIIEVNTVLLPTPGLHLQIRRLGNAPFASDLQVVIAFPFSAFGTTATNGPSPNLFLGFQTVGAFDALADSYPEGGHAPQQVDFFITPGMLAGTNHTFDLSITTNNASNPIRWLAGHFEAAPGGTIEDAIAMGILTDSVPATIDLGITTAASLPNPGTATGSFGIDWTASAPSKVIFDYIEAESFPFDVPDYGTTIQFNQMPTQQAVDVGVDFPNQTLSLAMAGDAPINEVTVSHRRSDGLDILLEAFQVPTQVDVELDMNGSVEILVNANTMDFELTATQEGGFPGANVFGYPMEFFYVAATNVPDTTATWDAANGQFSVAAINDGEFIGSLAFVIDDDARSIQDPEVELPPDQTGVTIGVGIPWNNPNRHIFSIIDDGSQGTVAARLMQVVEASLDFSSPSLDDITSVYTLNLAPDAQPLTGYVNLGEESTLFDRELQATCNVHNFPHGVTTFNLELPPSKVKFGYETDPEQRIDEVHCFGNVGTLNFDVLGSDLPPVFDFDFDPAGSLTVLAEKKDGTADRAGALSVRLWDPTDPDGLGLSTNGIFGQVLRDARARVDDVPSFNATWENDASKSEIDYNTVGNAFMGGAQVAVSTHIEFGAQLPGPSAANPHYLHFRDDGENAKKHLRAGIFGLDAFNYTSNQGGDNRSLSVSYVGDINRKLEATFVSPFAGKYFPAYELNLGLEVDAVPATWNLNTDFATQFQYTASAGLDHITLKGTIGQQEGDTVHTTNVDFLLDDAPPSVSFDLETGDPGSATLLLGSAIKEIRAELWSATKVLGEDYKHILLSTKDIPDGWSAEWALEGNNPSASLTTSAPLGPVSIVLSKDPREDTAGKYDVFKQDLAGIEYSAFTREIDRRYYRVGVGDAANREAAIMGRLDSLYGDTVRFNDGDDHFIMRKADGSTKFISIQGTGFQCASFQIVPPSGTSGFQCVPKTVAAGEVNVSAAIPVEGAHPFFVGIQNSDTEFTVAQVPDIPDTASVVVGATRAHIDFSSSPGTITLYKGGLAAASDGQTALKVQLIDTPSSVHAGWTLGFPGGVSIDASNAFEIRLLSQEGNDRTVAAFRVGDVSATWGIDPITTDEKCQLDPPGCGVYLQFAKVFFNFSANPALDGIIQTYSRIANPSGLAGGGPTPGAAEYVPVVSFLLDGFSRFEASAQFEICLVGVCPIGILLPNIDIDTDLLGAFNVDWWDEGGGFLNFFGDPDYLDNNPWHLWPVLHGHGSHLFPFGP